MLTDLVPPLEILLAIAAVAGLLLWPHSRLVALGVLVAFLLLAMPGCSSTPAPPPEPPALPAPILCAAPAGLTGAEPEPDRPAGDYTQQDVGLYLLDLHAWGWQGWQRLESVREHARACASNAEMPGIYSAIQEP